MSLGRGTVRAKVTVEGDDKAKRSLKEVERSFTQLGQGAKGMGALLGGLGPHAGAAVAALGTITVAAQAYLRAIELVARGMAHLAIRGGEVSAVATAFERVASPQLLVGLQRATGGLISNFDLMRQASRSLRTELVDESQLEEWFGTITRLAQDAGRDVPQAIENMANALTGGGLEGFQQLGINISAVRDELREMELSMESEEGRMKALAIAMDRAERQMGNVSNAASNLNDVFNAGTIAAGNFVDEVGRIVSESPAVVSALDTLLQKMTQFSSTSQLLGTTLATALAGWVQHLAAATSWFLVMAEAVGSIDVMILRFLASTTEGEVSAGHARNAAQIERYVAQLRAARQFADDLQRDIARAHAASSEPAPGAAPPPVGEPTEGRRPTHRGPRAREDAASRAAELAREAEERRKQGIAREVEDQNYLIELARERAALEFEDIQKIEAERIRVHEAEQARQEEANQLEMERIEAQREKLVELDRNERAAEERTASIIQNFASLAGSTQSLFGGITDLMEAMGAGAEETAKAEGAFLIAYNAVMAIVETAAAIRAFASQQYSEGALHTVAAATYTLAAVTAAARLGGGAATSAPAPSGSFQRSEPRNAERTGPGDGGVTIVHNYSLGPTEAAMGSAMENAIWQRRRSGVVPSEPLSVEYA